MIRWVLWWNFTWNSSTDRLCRYVLWVLNRNIQCAYQYHFGMGIHFAPSFTQHIISAEIWKWWLTFGNINVKYDACTVYWFENACFAKWCWITMLLIWLFVSTPYLRSLLICIVTSCDYMKFECLAPFPLIKANVLQLRVNCTYHKAAGIELFIHSFSLFVRFSM